MKFAYYPGCSLHSTSKEYNISTRRVCRDLGVTLEELPDWNCCGSTPAHSTDHLLSIALPARNLAISEAIGMDLVAPCAACFNRLKTAQVEMTENPRLAAEVNKVTGMEYQGDVQVFSLVDVIVNQVGLDNITPLVKRKLSGLKVAAYYGCLMVKPPKLVQFDDPENPHFLDDLMQGLGAETVEWPFKTECCGGSLSVSRTDIVVKLANDILGMAKANGANCVVTACPLCQVNLDLRQKEAEKMYGTAYHLPIYYFTELLGIALGHRPAQLGIDKHIVDGVNLLSEQGLAS
ncbi:MAG: CoB--CoM heterodisulfide reductase iron-sulfur subunit B family protein [Firmicutes bacterium]|nr:CoB--CoM heterodisulfide reductase iron-sulfur subunit B family protein [Bacillota bacterium]